MLLPELNRVNELLACDGRTAAPAIRSIRSQTGPLWCTLLVLWCHRLPPVLVAAVDAKDMRRTAGAWLFGPNVSGPSGCPISARSSTRDGEPLSHVSQSCAHSFRQCLTAGTAQIPPAQQDPVLVVRASGQRRMSGISTAGTMGRLARCRAPAGVLTRARLPFCSGLRRKTIRGFDFAASAR